MIKNLNQLKKALIKGQRFLVLDHHKKELIGQTREVNKVQTNGVYIVMANDPTHKTSVCNGGKGSWMEFHKSSHYEFGDTIKWFEKPVGSNDNVLISEIKLV